MTEQQVQLPKGWELKTLGDVGQYINGRGFKKAEWSQTGLPIIRIQNLTGTSSELNYFDGEIDDKHVIDNGDLLISWSATLGAYFWNRGKAALNQHIFKVVSKIDKKFHYYLIQNILNDLYRQAHGSGMVHITKAKFESTQVSIPQAEIDQKQIVAKIEELFSHIDAGIESLKTAQEKLKQYRQSVLKAAVTGELTKEWREQNSANIEPADQLLKRIQTERRQRWEQQKLAEFQAKGKPPKNDKWKEKYKDVEVPSSEDLPALPDSWVWSGLEQVSQDKKNALKAGPFGSALKKSFYVESGYKIYGQEQVINGDPYYGDYYINEERFNSLKSCSVEPGDLLISLVGTIGRTLILPEDIEPGIINPRLIKVSLDKELCIPEFIQIYIKSPAAKQIFKLASHGGTMDVINMTVLKGLPVPLPTINEQQIIIELVEEKLSSADRLMNEIETKLTQAQQQKQTILASAFKGELV